VALVQKIIVSPTLRTVGFALLLIIINLLWLLPVIRSTHLAASAFALQVADRVKTTIGLQIEHALGELTLGSEEIAVEPERRALVMRRLLRKNLALKSVSLADLSGMEEARVDRVVLVAPEDLRQVSDQETFEHARAGTAVVGDVFVSDSYEPRVTLAVPVYEAGVLANILIAELNLRNFIDVLRMPNGVDGTVYVVDHDGFQVLHPNLSELLKRPNFSSRAIVAKVVRQQVANGLSLNDGYIDERGESMFAVGMPIPVAGLSVVVEQPRKSALAVEYQMSYIAILTTLLGVVMFLLIVRGNARLKHISVKLSEANEQLLEMDRVKSEFVSVSAHQLRTPLTGIRWSLEMMLDREQEQSPTEQESMQRTALTTTISAIKLINELLDIARIEEGRLGYSIEVGPLAPVLTEALAGAAAEAKHKGITLDASIPSNLPALPIDRQKIGIVCANFLSNALKYTDRGGKVTLSAAKKGKTVEVTVSDTGIGIPANQQHRIFSQFFRASNAQRMSPSGSGLGLFLVKNIIARHGGTVTFSSKEGKGTKISFSIPLPASSKKSDEKT
jgi:signal transduction histidine kinase